MDLCASQRLLWCQPTPERPKQLIWRLWACDNFPFFMGRPALRGEVTWCKADGTVRMPAPSYLPYSPAWGAPEAERGRGLSRIPPLPMRRALSTRKTSWFLLFWPGGGRSGTEVQRWRHCPTPHSESEGSAWGSRTWTPSPGSRHAWGIILSPAFCLSSSYESPLLSHHLNLNKSSPSWPHPPAAAFLPRGPETPTTQGGQGGGPPWLPAREACTRPACAHTPQSPAYALTHTLLRNTPLCAGPCVCPALPQARHMCVPTQNPRAQSSRGAGTHGCTRAHGSDCCPRTLSHAHGRGARVPQVTCVPSPGQAAHVQEACVHTGTNTPEHSHNTQHKPVFLSQLCEIDARVFLF